LSLPYNLTSILTQNTGKYGADSFTTDRTLADKDKTKILLKIDPSTGLNTMDETGPHYKEQRKEAYDYAKTQLLSKIDREKKVQTSTGQLSDVTLGARQFAYGVKKQEQGAKNLGENVGKFFTGSTNDQNDASNYLNKIGVANYITEDAEKNPIFNIMGPDGKYVQFAPKTPNEVRSAISSIMGYAKKYISDTEIDETDAVKYAREFSEGKSVNKPGKAIGSEQVASAEDRDYSTEYKNLIDQIPTNIFGKGATGVVDVLKPILSKLNVTVENTSGNSGSYNTFRAPGKEPLELPSNQWTSGYQKDQLKNLIDYLNEAFPDSNQIEAIMKNAEANKPAPAPPAASNSLNASNRKKTK